MAAPAARCRPGVARHCEQKTSLGEIAHTMGAARRCDFQTLPVKSLSVGTWTGVDSTMRIAAEDACPAVVDCSGWLL